MVFLVGLMGRVKKGWMPLPLVLLLLSGCGGSPSPAEPEVLPEEPPVIGETVSLPEPRRLEPVSAPAIVTEGRAPEIGRAHV